MSEFRGSVPDQLPSFLYRLRDESPLAGSNRGDQLSFSESQQNSTVAKRMIPLSIVVLTMRCNRGINRRNQVLD